MQCETCPRERSDCMPLQNVVSDTEPRTFVCVGYNKPEDRTVAHDRFTMCWKNAEINDLSHWDKRDLLDTQSCIASALSIDENIRIGHGFTEEEMDQQVFLP